MGEKMNQVEQKLKEVMQPVDNQILMLDNPQDILMMACGMLQRVGEIFESQLGKEGSKEMFQNLINEKYNSGHLH
jgi:hypothetical protein